ncbi:hypothetical protein [Corynebacterium kroppenstedtii]|uniref:DNA polymerase III subunit epsilon n=1 Tax=Corynebacterium kroppenstedtii TaxID=161879 RepID=A0A2W5T5Z4_9CORY|nr:hypothetical protein [Corynebacterium kroppenstedtii]MDU7287577.1 hypothetical protein [Corynebacterium kroppenstedtii]PZR06875.1 MAG: hypothetical protein DI525_01010 [Corynebacterium kroppenstedtii]
MTSTSDHSSTNRGSDARTSHSHDVDPDRGGSNTGGSRSNDGHRRSRNNSRARRERRRRRATYSAQHGNKQQRAKEDSGNDTPNRSSGADSSGTQTGRKKNRRRARRRSNRPAATPNVGQRNQQHEPKDQRPARQQEQSDSSTQPNRRIPSSGTQPSSVTRAPATPGPRRTHRGLAAEGVITNPDKDKYNAGNTHVRSPREPIPSIEDAPMVAVVLRTTNIHPSTGRMLALDAAFFDADGLPVSNWQRVFNTDADPGPLHLFGLTPDAFRTAPRFSSTLRQIDRVIDGRVLIVHDTATTWGFIAQEARRTVRSASAKNRRQRRRRHNGHVPRPVSIIDTQATARRQGLPIAETRLRDIAAAYNLVDDTLPATTVLDMDSSPDAYTTLPGVGAEASERRRSIDPLQLLQADAVLVGELAMEQLDRAGIEPINAATFALHEARERRGDDRGDETGVGKNDSNENRVDRRSADDAPTPLVWADDDAWDNVDKRDPHDLRADRVGLQRSAIRIDAALAPVIAPNPGVWSPGQKLKRGMVFTVAPEVDMNPDDLIEAAVRAGLTYSEKLTRETSLVVFNGTGHGLEHDGAPHEGRALHAHRKGIPLVRDTEFMRLAEEATDAEQH